MDELIQYILSLGDQADQIGKSIIDLIYTFFRIGLVVYGLHALRLLGESIILKRFQNYLKINNGLGDIDNLLNRLRSAKVFLIPIPFIYKRFIIYRRINDLVQIKQNGGQIDNDVLGDIHAGVSSRKASLSNYILGILIILGLIGTLRGLILAIDDVQLVLQDIQDIEQFPQIAEALRQTLAGMDTAFATTLVGLGTSLILGFFGWAFNLVNSGFLTYFERVVSTDVMPHFTQTPEAAIESNIGQLTKSTDEFKNTVNIMGERLLGLSDSSWDGSLQQLYVFVNMFGEASDTFHKSSNEMLESQKEIQTTVKAYEKLTQDSMGKIDEYQSAVVSYKELVNQSMSDIEKYQESMHKGLDDTVESFRNYIVDYQEAMQDNLNNTVESFQGLITESMDRISGYQETLRNGLDNVVPDIRRESEVFKDTIREYQESQTRFIDELADTLLERLRPITESQQIIVEEFQLVRDDLREAARGLDIRSALEKQNDVFEELNNQIARTISDLIESQNRVFDGIKSQLIENQNESVNMLSRLISELEIRSTLEDQNKVFGRIEAHLGGQASLVAEQKEIMQTLNNNIQQLQQTLTQQGTERILNQISQKFDTLGENFGTLGNKLDTLNTTMSKPNLYRWGPVIRNWIPFIRKK
ncbi:hypothetical protein C6497_16865 [Candidatus Poribacteria bacterium]|nr:MAG: hypothetical protein C6497_16865 [Candidatus Poribacteria bacterium]